MMIGEINQDNLYLLLPSKVCRLAEMIQEYEQIPLIEAIKKVYMSRIYKLLEDEVTKTWHLGPVALYENYIEK